MNWYRQAGPLDQEMYGGIPDGGGYGSATEYEVGAHRVAEAAHCILGSLGKAINSSYPNIEIGHINEEMGIIDYCINEYDQPVYIERVWEENPDKERSYQNILQNSPRLKDRALSQKALLEQREPRYTEVAAACYDLLALLGMAMLESVQDYPQMKNAFTFPYLKNAANALKALVQEHWSFPKQAQVVVEHEDMRKVPQQVLDIGHHRYRGEQIDEEDKEYIWIWYEPGQLNVLEVEGRETHGTIWGWETEKKHWRGRTQMTEWGRADVMIMPPGENRMGRIPSALLKDIASKWGSSAVVHLFRI